MSKLQSVTGVDAAVGQPPTPGARHTVARNTLINLGSQGVPLLVGIVSLPYILAGLGPARYGVFTLAWTLVGYLTVLDLGLSRATTKFVAELTAIGDLPGVSRVAWTTIGMQIVLGVFGGGVLAFTAHPLAYGILKLPADMRREAYVCFMVLALSIPVVLLFNSLRGVLEAAQRFDLVNLVRAPFNTLYFLLPVGTVFFHASLATTMAGFIAAWVVGVAVQLYFCGRVFPGFLERPRVVRAEAKRLLAYGGWAAVSGVISPVLVYIDRVVIGAVIGVAAVSYYSAPFDIVTRLLVIPASLVATLFPAFSAVDVNVEGHRLPALLAKGTKYLLLAVGAPLLVIIVFADPILRRWLGASFELHSSLPLRILAVGVLINSLAQVPFSLVQARGRPDVTARFHLAELPIHVGLVFVGVHLWGIAGAALAWTLRVALDAGLLYGAAIRLSCTRRHVFEDAGVFRAIALLVCAGLAVAPAATSTLPMAMRLVLVLIVSSGSGWVLWARLLDTGERRMFLSLLGPLHRATRAIH